MAYVYGRAVYAPVMAYLQGGRVDKTDTRRLSPPESLSIQQKGEQGAAHQFHKPAVTDRRGEILPQVNADMPLVIPLEAAAA